MRLWEWVKIMRIPWSEMQALGIGLLGLQADSFWHMTMAEFIATCKGKAMKIEGLTSFSLTSKEFSDLRDKYPDKSGN